MNSTLKTGAERQNGLMGAAIIAAGLLVLLLFRHSLPSIPDSLSTARTDNTITIESCTDQVLKHGGAYKIPEGNCVIAGDIELLVRGNFVHLYDRGGENTGQVTECAEGCTIRTPYGASITQTRTAVEVGSQMLTDGCGSTTGCDIVYVLERDLVMDFVTELNDSGRVKTSGNPRP